MILMIEESQPISRRAYLLLRAMADGESWPAAREAVSSVAIEHPEWDLDEQRTLQEWVDTDR